MKLSSAWIAIVSLSAFVGCGAQPPPDEELESVEGALVTHNELTTNTIDPNGIDWNGIDWNGIDWNGIDWNNLDWNGIDWNGIDPNSPNAAIHGALQDPSANGDKARIFVKYLVSCSFKSSRTFQFTWTDASGVVHAESYPGHLGLAPHWATNPLGSKGEQLVSACMAAHVNYYGVPVLISIRSGQDPLRLHPHDNELDAYPDVEGAFWGNLWTNPPSLYACYNSANVANSRAHLRDCAAGHLNPDGTIAQCGIINIVGSCSSTCKKYSHSRGYYEDCRKNPGVNNKRTDLVITTALP
jgi:hypothetical protein